MDWEKLKLDHYHDQPVEHICITSLIDTNTYDRLYENQKDLNHQSWQEFKEKHKTNCSLHENISDIDLCKDVIWLRVFIERCDRSAS